MTTAHRPTFDPARGKETLRGPAYHQRLLPAHTQLKVRQPGQGGDADREVRDLRAELLRAEAAHFAKAKGSNETDGGGSEEPSTAKRQLGSNPGDAVGEEEDVGTKRRRILEETRDIDADSDGAEGSSSEDDSDEDDEDETAELLRELEKIKKERAEQRENEVFPTSLEGSKVERTLIRDIQERQKAAEAEEQREHDIARGNPLLNAQDFHVRRRWDDDVVFKNQARGTEDKRKKEFVNDLLRSDFHKRFMSKYVR
ncbi:MAG: complexed with cef1p [Geoglossum simile]|nr:MAG: complexed with cef1p [Geoglossum simile]